MTDARWNPMLNQGLGRHREAAVNATPIVKPERPETLLSVDQKLAVLAANLHWMTDPDERLLTTAAIDRLLDVRLAISKADSGDLA